MVTKSKYVGLTLGPRERITYAAMLHWIMFVPPLALAGLGFVIPTDGTPTLQWISIMLVAFGALKLIVRAIEWRTTEIVVTNSRVVVKTGLIRRTTNEINVSRIEGVNVGQSVLGRVLGYGTVTVQGTGGGIAPLRYVVAPLTLRSQLLAEPMPAIASLRSDPSASA